MRAEPGALAEASATKLGIGGERRPGYLGLCQGQLRGQDPWGVVSPAVHAGQAAGMKHPCESQCFGEEPEWAPSHHGRDGSGAACQLPAAVDSTRDPEKACRFGSALFSVQP